MRPFAGSRLRNSSLGVKSAKDETKLRTALASFRTVPIPDTLWETVGRNQATLRGNGLTLPLTDTAIATLAISLAVDLWTYDAHFALMVPYLSGLKLFQEPP
jgi:predicted nucleic acid-binding protein